MSETRVSVDVAVIGGGVAGLWVMNRLVNAGYNAVLLERNQLGEGQTILSQGMIHGGIKYALGGSLTGASEAIGDMPDVWRDCIAGRGQVDLRGITTLSDHFYLWSSGSLGSRMGSFFASKMLRGRIEEIPASQRPQVFSDPAFRGALYKLVDLVLDVPSLLQKLADNVAGRVIKIEDSEFELRRSAAGIHEIRLNKSVSICPKAVVLTAGKGNGPILEHLDLSKPQMQLRPLHQVVVTHDYPEPLYAHCMGANPAPRLTISSHRREDGRWAWYLGGDLATNGVNLDSAALIAEAKSELDSLFPWIDFGRCEWQTVYVDRAEPKQRKLLKPDNAFADQAPDCPGLIVAWPTKLTLAPDLADRVLKQLASVSPSGADIPPELAGLPAPGVARCPWSPA